MIAATTPGASDDAGSERSDSLIRHIKGECGPPMGRRVELLLKHYQLDQKELAAAARIGPPYLSRIIKGDVKAPGFAVVMRIADALNVHPRILYFGNRHTVANDLTKTADDNGNE
jgi:transcriptional regulator with XRE-family HTH domain